MKHFSSEEWVDFANKLATAEQAAAMHRHLEDGCKKCRKILQTWEKVSNVARRLPNYDPPSGAVRSVEAAFAMYGRQQTKNRIAEMAELIFDSFRQPSLEGVRATSVTTRKMLYRHGSLQIDLTVEPLIGSDLLSIDGQILDATKPDKPMLDVTVAVLGNRDEIARTQTNSFGEFHLECPARVSQKLSVRVDMGREVLIPLDLANEADFRG